MSIDPYSSPAAGSPGTAAFSESAVAAGVIQQLAGTKGWVRFISVLIFIGAAFMLLGGLAMLAAGGAIFQNTQFGAFGAGFGVGIALLYAVLAALYIYPALKLWSYASRIGSLMATGTVEDLEGALNEQRRFWKFIGVLFALLLSLYALVAVVAIIGAVAGASGLG